LESVDDDMGKRAVNEDDAGSGIVNHRMISRGEILDWRHLDDAVLKSAASISMASWQFRVSIAARSPLDAKPHQRIRQSRRALAKLPIR